MRRNKIDPGWNAIPDKRKKQRQAKKRLSWISQYESHTSIEQTFFEKIVKFLIKISLFFTISRTNFFNNRKKNEIIDSTYESLSSNKFLFIPAGVALYFFLSIIPILIIVISVINLVPNNWTDLLLDDVLGRIIPGIKDMIQTIQFNSTTVNIILLFFLLSLVWFSSKGITKFNDSFVSIYSYEYNSNWLIKRLKGFFTVCAVTIFFIIWSFAYLPLLDFIKQQTSDQILYEFLFYFTSFFYMIVFGYAGIGFLFLYIPPFKLKWRQIKPGILTALIPTMLFVLIFSLVTKFLNYEKFGPIGTFVYAVVFVLYLSYFLHAGIILNASYYKTYFSLTIVKKKIIISKKIAMVIENLLYRFRGRR